MDADVFTFASPSAFTAFADVVEPARLRGLSESARFAAIGLTTAAAIREAGFAVEIIAEESTCGGIRGGDRKIFRAAFRGEIAMSFPVVRPRRMRRTEAIRNLACETRLTKSGFIYPMFACPGSNVRKEVSSMPGIYQQSVDQIVEECREVEGLGIPGVILFGLPAHKDETGSEAAAASGAVQRAVEAIKKAKLNLIVITDVCLCEYTSHGHCGVVKDGEVLNDPSLDLFI